MLQAGVARAVINPPLTISQGGWGAQTHVTPSHVESDICSTVLVLADDSTHTQSVIVDLDLCMLSNKQAAQIRSQVAEALEIPPQQVRVSATHTHAGPVVGDNFGADDYSKTDLYFDLIIEQTVGAALQALRQRVPVSVQAEYGLCHIAKNRRQVLEDGSIITGYNEDGYMDPTVSTVRFDDEHGQLVASLVHYSCHPTTLGYTNQAVSADYPGVTKKFVEQTLGGTCLFLQGATGDIGPGPGGFLDRIDIVHDIGTALGCAAVQALIAAKNKSYQYEFDKVVLSGASLGIWNRSRKPLGDPLLQVISETLMIPTKEMKSPAELQEEVDNLRREIVALRETNASDEEMSKRTYRMKRLGMALRRSQTFYGMKHAPIEAHFIRIGDTVLIGIPLEPFAKTAMTIREKSPFAYTLFSGYSNGYDGYLPAADDYPAGGYEVDNTAFSAEAADQLIEQVLTILHKIK